MVSFYCTVLNLTLVQVRNMIEFMFPENESTIVEYGTVLVSEGDDFDCSVEPGYCGRGLYLTADYHGTSTQFEKLLSQFTNALDQLGATYDIECEIDVDTHVSYCFCRHPDYEDADTSIPILQSLAHHN